MIESVYFKEEEFGRCSPPCSLQDMDARLVSMLDLARAKAGIPFVLNSAYRPVAWEKSHGRAGTSAHCSGKAVDIRCGSSSARFRVVSGLLAAGFRRIGVGRTFVHADCDAGKAQDVIWDYYE